MDTLTAEPTLPADDALCFEPDLIRRYDRPGARYTSYPTALEFHTGFGVAELSAAVARSNASGRELSLYVHVPFCLSPCFYCGCTRIITRDKRRGARYLTQLKQEISVKAAGFDRSREVIQLHLGGGTPNFLSPEQIAELVRHLGECFTFSDSPRRDFSIELDPRSVSPADIAALAAIGFNRASLGVQDFDPAVQAAVNREQGVAETLALIDAARAAGFASVNVDLIYGLPGQTVAGFGRTLDTVLAALPDRLAIYGYAHLPQLFKAQQRIDPAQLPSAATRLELLGLAIHKLTAVGYHYIGMDHFARPGDELSRAHAEGSLHRNFMGYTTHAQTDLVGFGMSAISKIDDSYSQNLKTLPEWETAMDNGHVPLWRGVQLSADDRIRADAIQQLMCQDRLDLDALGAAHAIDAASYFADDLKALDELIADDLVQVEARSVRVRPRGRLLLRNIAACFDAYRRRGSSAPQSRAI